MLYCYELNKYISSEEYVRFMFDFHRVKEIEMSRMEWIDEMNFMDKDYETYFDEMVSYYTWFNNYGFVLSA